MYYEKLQVLQSYLEWEWEVQCEYLANSIEVISTSKLLGMGMGSAV